MRSLPGARLILGSNSRTERRHVGLDAEIAATWVHATRWWERPIRSRRGTSAETQLGMSTNRENIPWNATVMVSVGPLRCLATMKSASPWRGLSFS